MNTSSLPAAIGIDIAKDTFVAAFDGTHTQKFPNTEDGVGEFLACARGRGFTPETTIGVEATGVYHLRPCLTLKAYGWRPVIINPLLVNRYAKLSLRRTKTDPKDARTIRHATQNGEGYVFTDTRETVALRAALAVRNGLAALKQQLAGQSHAHAVRAAAAREDCPDLLAPVRHAVNTQLRRAERELQQYERATQRLLTSIPGIGPVAAATLVAVVGSPCHFPTFNKFVAFVGIDPGIFQSGTSIDRSGTITKRGNTTLRRVLYQCAFIATRHDAEFAAYYRKKTAQGKHHVKVLCALEKKLCARIWAVWRRGTPFVKQ